MKIFLLILLTLISTLSSFSQQGEQIEKNPELKVIEIRLSHLDTKPVNTPLIGEEINIRFELSEEMPIHFFQGLVQDKFLFSQAAYISQVKELAMTNKGFAKAFEAKAAFVSPVVPKSSYDMPLEGLGVELKIINLNVEVMNDPEIFQVKKPQVATQEFTVPIDRTRLISAIVLGAIILLIIGIYLFLRTREIRAKKRYQKKWQSFLLKAESRKELERTYLLKNRWSEVLEINKKDLLKFSQVINRYQYQEQWNQEHLQKVKKALNETIGRRL